MNSDLKEIQDILIDSRQFGLEYEVKQWAALVKSREPEIKLVDAYRIARDEWIK